MAAEAYQAHIRPAIEAEVLVKVLDCAEEMATRGWRRRDVQTLGRTGCARMSYGWGAGEQSALTSAAVAEA